MTLLHAQKDRKACDPKWPADFEMRPTGLHFQYQRLTGPFEILGMARQRGEDMRWSLVLRWSDPGDGLHVALLGLTALHDQKWVAALVSGGLWIATAKRRKRLIKRALSEVSVCELAYFDGHSPDVLTWDEQDPF